MLWFDGPIFDKEIGGIFPVATAAELNDKLGEPGGFELTVYADQVGTDATLTVSFEVSPDGVNWLSLGALVNLDDVLLTGNTLIHSAVPNSTKFTRLQVALGGAQPQARIRMWAAGRTFIGGSGTLGQRVFHELVFDRALVTPLSVGLTEGHELLLACTDSLYFFVVADNVAPVPSVLTLKLFEGPDGVTWAEKVGWPLPTAPVTLPAYEVTSFMVADTGILPSSGLVRLLALLSQVDGDDPDTSAHIRIWATGRVTWAI